MNKLLIAIALCAALAACKKEPAADTAAVSADSGLPQACQDYLNRAKACFAKSSGNAAAFAFQQAIDQSKAQWEAMPDKSGLAAGCKAANDQFAQTVAALKCE